MLLDSGAQPLIWAKLLLMVLDLTNVNLDPCLYQILTSVDGLKITQGLTK